MKDNTQTKWARDVQFDGGCDLDMEMYKLTNLINSAWLKHKSEFIANSQQKSTDNTRKGMQSWPWFNRFPR